MTSKIIVNNIEADAGVSTVTFGSNISASAVTSSGAVTAGSITVGNSVITSTSIGIGTTTTAGRNAGVGTAVGTLIFNSTTNQLEVYSPQGWIVGAEESFRITSPTVTADTSSRPGYAVFTFTSPGSIEVTNGPGTIEYFVIGGGGAGAVS